MSPEMHIAFSLAGMMAPDGRCKSFDARADGYTRGEGCVLLALQRLSDAVEQGANIYAVIRGTAINHDGTSNGVSAPNGLAQRAVIEQALAVGEIDPKSIGLIEAHGTGTPLGDPIEVEALAEVYGAPRDRARCALGSVKTNIGHLESVAGVAGVVKAALALHHRSIPPTIHFREPNPDLALEQTPFYVPVDTQAWPRSGSPRRAAVSSFGVGGTNAHVILEEAEAQTSRAPTDRADRSLFLLPLSARNESALAALCERWATHLEAHPELGIGDICFTAGVGRAHLAQRAALVATTTTELCAELRALSKGDLSPRDWTGKATDASRLAALQLGELPAAATAGFVSPEDAGHVAPEAAGTAGMDGQSWATMLEALARLYVAGVSIDWRAVDAGFSRRRLALPTYPFQRRRCWLEPDEITQP